MRVRFLEGAASEQHVYYPTEEAELPDALAERYIAAGTCEAVKPKRGARRETAARNGRELAINS